MANAFLDRLRAMGLYGSDAAPMANMEGIPPEMLEAAQRQSRLGIGAQLMAAGFARDPRARAEALAGISEAADISRPLYNMAQAKLMATPRERETRTDIVESDGRLLLIDLSTGEVIRDVGPAPNRGGNAGGPNLSTRVDWAQDADGNWVPIQAGDDGQFVRSAVPDGLTPVGPADMAGNKVQAQEQAKAGQTVPAALSSVQQTRQYIDELLANPGLETATGEVQGALPDWAFSAGSLMPGSWGEASSNALAARKRMGQIEGRAFLAAYETLKGTGQITEIEGEKATKALFRMETATTDEEYYNALQDFRDGLADIERVVQAKAGRYAPGAGGAPQSQAQPQSQSGGIPRITSAADYANLPPGPYIDPNGVQRVKR